MRLRQWNSTGNHTRSKHRRPSPRGPNPTASFSSWGQHSEPPNARAIGLSPRLRDLTQRTTASHGRRHSYQTVKYSDATAQRIFQLPALQSTYASATAPALYVRARVRAKKTVRRECSSGVEADRRSADLPRWQTGGVYGPDRRCGGQQEAGAGLDCAPRGRRRPADYAGWRE